MAINVIVSGSGTIIADVNGAESANVAITGGEPVDVSVVGGIGPAAYVNTANTTIVGVNPIEIKAGANITVSAASGSYTITGREPPVQSVQGRTGNVVLSLADLTAAASSHTHSTTQISGFTASLSAASPVQSVQGRTGSVVLSVSDLTAAAATHTHSTADVTGFVEAVVSASPVLSVQGRTGAVVVSRADLTAAAATHTHSTTDVTGFTAAASAAAPVQSVQGRTGSVTISLGDLTAAAASHTHSALQVSGLTAAAAAAAPVQSVQGRTGAVTLSVADLTAAAATHTHSASDISGVVSGSSPVQSVQGRTGAVVISRADLTAAAASHTHSTTDVTGFTAAAAAASPVQTVQGRTGNVVLSISDLTAAAASHTHSTAQISNFSAAAAAAAPVQTVQGRTGSVTLSLVDISAASSTHTHNFVQSLNAITGAMSIVGGQNVTVQAGGSTVTISAAGGGGGGFSWQPVPSSPSSIGADGSVAYDPFYFYVKSSSGWRRASLSSWTELSSPVSLTAFAGNLSAFLNWSVPVSDGGYPVTDYEVQYSSNNGSTWTTFTDGVSTATSANVTGLSNGTNYVFRVAAKTSTGTGPYSSQSNSITPTSGDPFFSNVSLLLHMNGTAPTDSSSSNVAVTVNGGASLSTEQVKQGFGKSAKFSESSPGWFSTPTLSNFGFRTRDFTIEFWVYPTEYTNVGAAISVGYYFNGLLWRVGALNYDTLYINNSFFSVPNLTPLGQWTHLALVRVNGNVSIYANGVLGFFASFSEIPSQDLGDAQPLLIGTALHQTNERFVGFIDELRITKAARYMVNFSPPQSEFPDNA